MRVRLLLFAVLRDLAGSAEQTLELGEGTRAGQVWESLRRQYPELAAYRQPPLTAINEEYANAATELRDGDDLAFIPPVSGG